MSFNSVIGVDALAGLERESAAGGRAVLLDCRFDLTSPGAGRSAYAKAHIPGARYVDLNQALASPPSPQSGRHPLPSPGALAGFFDAAGIRDGTQVVAYDDVNGSIAARAWWTLRWLGHSRAAVLDGGFKAWVESGGAVESGEPIDAPRAPGHFKSRIRTSMVMSTADVRQALSDPQRLLVDARAAERFAGLVEPLDPVAGHVPGAVNQPFTGNLTAQGRFLPAAELRRLWLERLAGTDPAAAVMMCGSGVTACHNLLAMEAAGLPGGKLYAGSWSEWIRDPARPVAR